MSLVTIHGTIMVFFVLTAGLSGTFANLLIPLQIGARDMASPFVNMLSYWFFLTACIIMLSSFLFKRGYTSEWLDSISTIISIAEINAWFGRGDDAMAYKYGMFCGLLINGRY